MKKAPTKFNKKMKAAAAAGKLDKNPKLKAAVEKAGPPMKKGSMATLKKSSLIGKAPKPIKSI